MNEPAITVTELHKSFRLPHEKSSGIKQLIINPATRKKGYETQRVLRDVSFEIQKGEFFGIVGRNGSGKSTLLKLLAGIYAADKGHIQVNGSLTPFIELGVGFNPELTGHENVFLNGALLGFGRKEMEAMYDDIVDFAELRKFMDQKLKNYSSGMQVRLAFSIAIRANADILILDEVLAVGDEAFQQKCIDVFERYKAEKRTIVLVTHSMESVRRFCNRALLLDEGKIIEIGSPEIVSKHYTKLNAQQTSLDIIKSNQSKHTSNVKVRLCDKTGDETTVFQTGDELYIKLSWPEKMERVKNVGTAIVKNTGEIIYGGNTLGETNTLRRGTVTQVIQLDLGPGKYHIMAGLFGENGTESIDFFDQGPEFIIEENDNDLEQGMIRLKNEWRY